VLLWFQMSILSEQNPDSTFRLNPTLYVTWSSLDNNCFITPILHTCIRFGKSHRQSFSDVRISQIELEMCDFKFLWWSSTRHEDFFCVCVCDYGEETASRIRRELL
jgi:hypothetical protein